MAEEFDNVFLGFDSEANEYVRIGRFLIYRDGTIGEVDGDMAVHVKGADSLVTIASRRENRATEAEVDRYYDNLVKLSRYMRRKGEEVVPDSDKEKPGNPHEFAKPKRKLMAGIVQRYSYLVAGVLGVVCMMLNAPAEGMSMVSVIPAGIILGIIPAAVMYYFALREVSNIYHLAMSFLGAAFWMLQGLYGFPAAAVLGFVFLYTLLK